MKLRHLVSLCFLMLAFILSSCDSQRETPDDYESLLGFIYGHAGDEDPAELREGLENLHSLLQDEAFLEEAMNGYVIDDLGEEAVDNLDNKDRSADNLSGISVVTKSPHSISLLAKTLTREDFDKIVSANFDSYKRDFVSDPSCFKTRDCNSVEAHSQTESMWGGLIKMKTNYTIQFRWVETNAGWMLLHRFWLEDKAEGDCCDLVMHENFYVSVSMADAGRSGGTLSPKVREAAAGLNGGAGDRLDTIIDLLSSPGTLRVHSNWFNLDYGLFPIPEDDALDTVVDNSKNDAKHLDDWITANDPDAKAETEAGAETESTTSDASSN